MVRLGEAPPRGEWEGRGLNGVVRERKLTANNGVRYTLVVRRRGLPDRFAGGLAPILIPLEFAAFAFNKLCHRGYGVELRPTAQPGWWKRARPLPAEQILVVGPFARQDQAIAEADAIASRLLRGDYPADPSA